MSLNLLLREHVTEEIIIMSPSNHTYFLVEIIFSFTISVQLEISLLILLLFFFLRPCNYSPGQQNVSRNNGDPSSKVIFMRT